MSCLESKDDSNVVIQGEDDSDEDILDEGYSDKDVWDGDDASENNSDKDIGEDDMKEHKEFVYKKTIFLWSMYAKDGKKEWFQETC